MAATVSIILPVFNRLHYLRAAVDSVLAQTFEDWELIIADDESGAETQRYMKDVSARIGPRVKVLWLKHVGNPDAVRNIALREVQSPYVAFLDSDDVWLPRKLQAQLEAMRSCGTREWSYTRCLFVDGSGQPLTGKPSLRYPQVKDGWILESVLAGEAAVVQSSFMATRQALAAVGGYPEDMPGIGDYELFVRLALRSEISFIDEPLVLLRHHEEHYFNDDVLALTELRYFFEKIRRLQVAPHMEALLCRRRAEVSAGLARSYSVSGRRFRALITLAASARHSWRHRQWWVSAMGTAARAAAPPWVWRRLRKAILARRRERRMAITG
ncbi:MAG TPA: glycosyltransferase family 2 protein [Steroidobacteraceae bacterium]|jgi:glycosyltransferase involved in cell wall biosynthesis|nr:glycosyltransferase family 2 protein [Steroidobacteraceae bacterium]